jgi:hypothetical protein
MCSGLSCIEDLLVVVMVVGLGVVKVEVAIAVALFNLVELTGLAIVAFQFIGTFAGIGVGS